MAIQTTDIDGKQKALSLVLKQIESNFGKGAIMFGRCHPVETIPVVHLP